MSCGVLSRAARGEVFSGMECKTALIASAGATLGLSILFVAPPALALTLAGLIAVVAGLAARFTPEEA